MLYVYWSKMKKRISSWISLWFHRPRKRWEGFCYVGCPHSATQLLALGKPSNYWPFYLHGFFTIRCLLKGSQLGISPILFTLRTINIRRLRYRRIPSSAIICTQLHWWSQEHGLPTSASSTDWVLNILRGFI